MDLLGSILGKMDAPPAAQVDEETKKKVRGSNLNNFLTETRSYQDFSSVRDTNLTSTGTPAISR